MINRRPEVVSKVWGHEEICVNTDLYCGKLLHLMKGFRCSIHKHEEKDETFYILTGKVQIELFAVLNDELVPSHKFILIPGNSIRIEPGTYHRFTGIVCATILEVSTCDKKEDSFRVTQSEKVPE